MLKEYFVLEPRKFKIEWGDLGVVEITYTKRAPIPDTSISIHQAQRKRLEDSFENPVGSRIEILEDAFQNLAENTIQDYLDLNPVDIGINVGCLNHILNLIEVETEKMPNNNLTDLDNYTSAAMNYLSKLLDIGDLTGMSMELSPFNSEESLLNYVQCLANKDINESGTPRETNDLVENASNILSEFESNKEISGETKESYLSVVGKMINNIADRLHSEDWESDGTTDMMVGFAHYMMIKAGESSIMDDESMDKPYKIHLMDRGDGYGK